MKKIYVTQRVEYIESINERRDCIDQKLVEFLFSCGLIPIVISNNRSIVENMLNIIEPDGIFLSGGNNLIAYGGDALERDSVEMMLIDWGIKHKLPICGICRGMQMLIHYFGYKINKVNNHVAVKHQISGDVNRVVNSYHEFGIERIGDPFQVLARSADDNIECIYAETLKLLGIMWHPERGEGYENKDIQLVSNFFSGNPLKIPLTK